MFDGIHGTPISGATISGGPISGRSADWHNAGNYISPDSEFIFDGRALPAGLTYSRASGATFIDSGGNLVEVAANVPRFVPGGLLIERIPTTNWNRNPRGEYPSTPTFPTTTPPSFHAAVTGGIGGMSAAIVGDGVESGARFWDVRYFGTAASAGTMDYRFDTPPSIPALTGQVWTNAVSWRIVGGDTTRLGSWRIGFYERNNVGGQVLTSAGNVAAPTALVSRAAATVTLAGGVNTVAVIPVLLFDVTAPGAVNITLRLSQPQAELGSFASSLVLPPPGSPAVATRAPDILNIDPALIGLDRNSIAIRFRSERGGVNVPASSAETILGLAVGDSVANSVRLTTLGGQTAVAARFGRGGIFENAAVGSVGSGTFQSACVAWDAAGAAAAFNGAAPGTSGQSPLGAITTARVGDAASDSQQPSNLTLQYLRIWKGRRLSAAQVQTQSARLT